MGVFSDSVKNNSNKTMRRVNEACYRLVKQLFSTIINFTPSPAAPGLYSEGVLANQWYPSNGSTFSTSKSDVASPTAALSHFRVDSLPRTEFLRRDGVVTMANNMDYSYRAEVLGWPAPKWSGGNSGGGYQGTGGPYRMVARGFQVVVPRWK